MAALPKPDPLPIGIVKQFGPYGPEYEVLGPAEPENGRPQVKIVLVRTGEEISYSYTEMMQDPEAL